MGEASLHDTRREASGRGATVVVGAAHPPEPETSSAPAPAPAQVPGAVDVVDASDPTEGGDGGGGLGSAATLAGGTAVAALGLVLLIGLGFTFRDDIEGALTIFSTVLEGWGAWGYVAYAAAYAALEVLAVPAIPLTMTAGVLFGPIAGSLVVSFAATLAATIAFLIARYVARDRIASIAKRNPKFAAIDAAIGKESFKVVLLLRLSPLLPFALSNYLYGLTSVDLGPYVLGSWLGMLPGTFAYVSAGDVGKVVLGKAQEAGAGGGGLGATLESTWPLLLGVGGTILATTFLSRVVLKSLKDLEEAPSE